MECERARYCLSFSRIRMSGLIVGHLTSACKCSGKEWRRLARVHVRNSAYSGYSNNCLNTGRALRSRYVRSSCQPGVYSRSRYPSLQSDSRISRIGWDGASATYSAGTSESAIGYEDRKRSKDSHRFGRRIRAEAGHRQAAPRYVYTYR